MEKTLTPMQRAYRQFLSGRPPDRPKDTPLGAVSVAIRQAQRLDDILGRQHVKGARITSMGVVIRFVPHVPEAPADFVLVEEGKEGQAIAFLEQYGAKFKRNFVIAGLLFAVQAGKEKRAFPYSIERTPEGEAALMWSFERQIQRKAGKGTN
jgi:hypothetical protein